MDVRRHVTAGRLAELFGEDGARDRQVHPHHGLAPGRRAGAAPCSTPRPARRSPPTPRASTPTSSSTARPRSRWSTRSSALTGLDYEPEPWTPVDSLAWLKAMAWDLRGNMDDEIDRVLASLDHAPERGRRALPRVPLRARTRRSSGSGGVVDGVFEQNASGNATRNPRRPAYSDARWSTPSTGVRDAAGPACPTCWAAATASAPTPGWSTGEHSATGAPLLANDPHLGVSHARHLDADGPALPRRSAPTARWTSSGFTFSGVPGVIIGHNADIAWGFTNLGPDVTDLYLEQVEGEPWIQDGEAQPLRHPHRDDRGPRRRRLRALQIRETAPRAAAQRRVARSSARSAPTPRRTSRTPTGRGNGYAVALQWTALDPAPPPTRSSPSTGRATGTSSGRRPPTSPYRRRTSSTPTARATSATRRRAGSRSASPATTGRMPAEGWLLGQRLDRRRTSPSTACPACSTPRRASSSPPTRPSSARTTPTSSPATGTTATAPTPDPPAARGARASCRSTR